MLSLFLILLPATPAMMSPACAHPAAVAGTPEQSEAEHPAAHTAAAEPRGNLAVSNVHLGPGPFTTHLSVTYDLETVGNDVAMVRLFLSIDGGGTFPHLCSHVTGDVGPGVLQGTSREIVWHFAADLPGIGGDSLRLRVVADDSSLAPYLVHIAPGSFLMGSPTDEPGRFPDETLHPAALTGGFYMLRHEVTGRLWEEVTGIGAGDPDAPAVDVSWDMAVAFCNALSVLEGLTPAYTIHGPNGDVTWRRDADGYRLPTEAEWEYACRAGS